MSKQIIRLNERQLRQIVKESVKKAGHLYWKDDDGTIHTNSKETWRGVPGTTFI